MGRFDIERILRDLGDPSESAPREPGDELGRPIPAESGEVASVDAAPPVSRPEVGRPPDFRTGDGLGTEIDAGAAAAGRRDCRVHAQ